MANFRDALQRAKGLFIEMPPDESEEPRPATPRTGGTIPLTVPSSASSSSSSPPSATDKLWEEIEQQVKRTQTKTVDQIVREAAGPNLDQIQMPKDAPLLTPNAAGALDFAAIYKQAGVPKAVFSAEQTLDMILGLPKELPLDIKRQTLHVTMGAMGKALGATPETVVADASRKLAALTAYCESATQRTTDILQKTEAEISSLLAKAEELRKASTEAQQRQTQTLNLCAAEADRLDDILEFFSLDQPPSKYAPSAPQADPTPAPKA